MGSRVNSHTSGFMALLFLAILVTSHAAKAQTERVAQPEDPSGSNVRAESLEVRKLQEDPDIPTVGLGEPCRFGGNIRPIACKTGLYCDGHRPAGHGVPGRPGFNPDAAASGVCKSQENSSPSAAEAPAPAPAPGDDAGVSGEPVTRRKSGLGGPCRVGGNMIPQFCETGLFCDARRPQVGSVGWNPDISASGTCRAQVTMSQPDTSVGAQPGAAVAGSAGATKAKGSLVLASADNSTGSLGEACDIGAATATPAAAAAATRRCSSGLVCVAQGSPISGVGAQGVCQSPAPQGRPCFAQSSPSATDGALLQQWSWPCMEGLVCLALDPVPPILSNLSFPDPAVPLQSKASSNAESQEPGQPSLGLTGFNMSAIAGFCFSASAAPSRSASSAPGSAGGQCSVASGAAAGVGPTAGSCSQGLTCVESAASSNSSLVLEASGTPQASGVCSDETQLVTALGLQVDGLPLPASPPPSTKNASPAANPGTRRAEFSSAQLVLTSLAVLAAACL